MVLGWLLNALRGITTLRIDECISVLVGFSDGVKVGWILVVRKKSRGH